MSPELFQSQAHTIVLQCTRTLEQMDAWIGKIKANAGHRKYDPNTLLQARLAPDMFPLVRQYGAACDNLKLMAARLSGKQAPVHADNQTSWDEVHTRIQDVLAWVRALQGEDFANAAQTRATFPWYPGKMLAAEPYLVQYALPNFYFHATTAYAILRTNGVELGKADFLGALPFQDA
jgi:hypothetical protein